MCGFYGVFHKDPNRSASLNELYSSSSLAFRGPDESEEIQVKNYAVKFYRLSIIGDDEGKQPIINNGKILFFNGEIYNFKSFQQSAKSDTKVLFDILDQENNNLLNKCHGMFAFAFFDQKKNKIILGRDFWGKKPLYYVDNKESVFFSSSIEPLINHINKKNLNNIYLSSFFTYGYSIIADSPFSDIKQIQAGEVKSFTQDNETYFNLLPLKINPEIQTMKQDDIIDNLTSLVTSAVEKKAYDNSVLYLSEGVDSQIINKVLQKKEMPYKSITIEFENYSYNENIQFKSRNHSKLLIGNSELKQSIDHTLGCSGVLHANPANIAFFLLSKYSSNYSKVALTGGGGDELFYGYPTWLADKYSKFTISLPTIIKNNLASLIESLNTSQFQHNKVYALQKIFSLEKNDYKKRHFYWRTLKSRKIFESVFSNLCFGIDLVDDIKFNHLQNSEFVNLAMTDLDLWWGKMGLVQADTFGMINGVEIRSIYCEEDLASFCFSLSNLNFIKPGSKKLLKSVGKKIGITPSIKKRPFSVPLSEIYRENDKYQIYEEFAYLADKINLDVNFNELRKHSNLKSINELLFLHTINCFNVWCKKYVL